MLLQLALTLNAVRCLGESTQSLLGDRLATQFADAVRPLGKFLQGSIHLLQRHLQRALHCEILLPLEQLRPLIRGMLIDRILPLISLERVATNSGFGNRCYLPLESLPIRQKLLVEFLSQLLIDHAQWPQGRAEPPSSAEVND